MSIRKTVSYTALMLSLSASASLAEITGPEVWSDWKTYMQGFGYTMTGTETQSGNRLDVSDITMTYTLPENEGTFGMSMGALGFTSNANGTVTVDLPANMPVTFDVTPATGEAAKGTVNIGQTAPVMIVSGDAGDFTYTYSANAVTVGLEGMEVDGTPLPPEMLRMQMTMADVSNTTRTTVGDLRGYTSNMTASGLTYDVSFDVPEGPDAGAGTITGSMRGLAISADASFAPDMDATDLAAMLAAGTSIKSSFTYQGGNSDIDLVSPDGPVKATTSTDGGFLTNAMGPNGLSYDVQQSNLKVNMQTAQFPLPIALEMATSAFNLAMPLAVSQETQDFAFGFTMGDFTISDSIWGLFDPAGQLPRDPATIALDLGGKAKVLADMFNPERMATGQIPGEINELSINNVLISALGANITATGGFTFDNSDMTTFGGAPRPEGSVNVVVKGANGLLDTLVNMGLLPQEQAMGARMMMGLFGVPQGDDTLTSKIEVNEQGHVLANGQRLR